MVFLYQNCGQLESNGNLADTDSDTIQFNKSATDNEQAITLFRRLAGVTLSIDDPIIKEMEGLIAAGDSRGAAAVAANQPGFLNITVRDFASKMGTRDQTVAGEFNDFIATVMGSVRDNVPAISLLTGNFYYRAVGVTDVRQDLINDIVTSNNHYNDLADNVDDLASVLEREDGQKVMTNGDNITVLRDAAGLMTTRGWMQQHAIAGTNRRMIEYAFKIFACTPIEEWASANRSDNFVGRDVSRVPSAEYQTKCKSCHAGMDSLRPATAYFDYEEINAGTGEGQVNYRFVYQNDPDDDNPNRDVPVPNDQQLVPYKFRRASGAFPGGFVVRNTSWVNYASQEQFGFRRAPNGSGMNSFGQLIATSEQFSRCMVERVFKTVCRQQPDSDDRAVVQQLATEFENGGYILKDLFLNVSVHPSCLGLEL